MSEAEGPAHPDSPKTDPLDRLPHAGPARLPGRVVGLEPSVRVRAQRQLAAGDACLNDEGFLPSFMMVELMAQVGGLLIDESGDDSGGAAGDDYALLAGVKRMHLHGAARAGDLVDVSCTMKRRMGDLYLIECRAEIQGREQAHGEIQIRRVRKSVP